MGGISLDFVTPRWESADWIGEFYPEDLPGHWRLAYYSNEFPSVLIPASRWVSAGADEWADWVSDVPASFRIYLELSPQFRTGGSTLSIRKILGHHFAGFLLGWTPDGTVAEADGLHLFCRDNDSRGKCLPALYPAGGSCDDLRAARAWLTGLPRRFGDGPLLVVLDDHRVDAESLRRWWKLAWLLGLA
jgi:hypothetical protein